MILLNNTWYINLVCLWVNLTLHTITILTFRIDTPSQSHLHYEHRPGMSVTVLSSVVPSRKKTRTTVVDNTLFHYIKVPDEECCPEEVRGWKPGGKYVDVEGKVMSNGHTVMTPIDRHTPKPEVRRIPGIKTKFFLFQNTSHRKKIIASNEKSSLAGKNHR